MNNAYEGERNLNVAGETAIRWTKYDFIIGVESQFGAVQ